MTNSNSAEVGPDLSIVLVNWNTCEDLKHCLQSAFAEPGINIQIIVVDNASSDGSASMTATEFPSVKLIRNIENVGFAKASNQGIEISSGRYVMLLNPDSEVQPGAFRSLIDFADANPDAGIIGIKVLNSDGSLQYSCRRFPTLRAAVFRNTIIGRFFPRDPYTRDYLMTDLSHDQVMDVDWVSGCALTVRRQVIDQIGVLDERFFMYCEDVDYGLRAHQQGWRVVYFPGAAVIHARARGSDQNRNAMIVEFHRSMYRFFKKHYWKSASLFVRAIVPLGLVIRAGGFVARNYYYDVLRGRRKA